MIEVEKKFLLSDEEIAILIEKAELITTTTIKDSYFDTPDFKLLSKDFWLRNRDGKFELKIPLKFGKKAKHFNQYRELTSEEEIKKLLKLNGEKLENLLEKNGYLSFAKIVTTRKKYKKGEFIIDLDLMDYGYSIAEVELMVEDELEMEEATNKITNFAQEHGLKIVRVRGKVLEYLVRFYPEKLQKLIELGVFKPL